MPVTSNTCRTVGCKPQNRWTFEPSAERTWPSHPSHEVRTMRFSDHRIFTVSDELSSFADGWFDEGAVTFETGANTGRTIEVKSWMQAIRRLELWAPTGLPVAVGDQLRIYPGCHKRVLEDCRDRVRIPGSLLFDQGNVRNFRGEPYVPGSPLTAVQVGRG